MLIAAPINKTFPLVFSLPLPQQVKTTRISRNNILIFTRSNYSRQFSTSTSSGLPSGLTWETNTSARKKGRQQGVNPVRLLFRDEALKRSKKQAQDEADDSEEMRRRHRGKARYRVASFFRSELPGDEHDEDHNQDRPWSQEQRKNTTTRRNNNSSSFFHNSSCSGPDVKYVGDANAEERLEATFSSENRYSFDSRSNTLLDLDATLLNRVQHSLKQSRAERAARRVQLREKEKAVRAKQLPTLQSILKAEREEGGSASTRARSSGSAAPRREDRLEEAYHGGESSSKAKRGNEDETENEDHFWMQRHSSSSASSGRSRTKRSQQLDQHFVDQQNVAKAKAGAISFSSVEDGAESVDVPCRSANENAAKSAACTAKNISSFSKDRKPHSKTQIENLEPLPQQPLGRTMGFLFGS
ncbi:unnamed protein product [Amoebophrya sp. A25]|nr:unnamed protein product [Amoebophrya sp. A25]|eukprot:GSA25T00008608001.1